MKASVLFISAAALAVHLQANAAPLSCEMQSMLAGLAATARDQGKTPAQVQAALKKSGDLTNSEIKALIDIAFVHMKKSSPQEISQAVTMVCKK